jgi:hypothetical protein
MSCPLRGLAFATGNPAWLYAWKGKVSFYQRPHARLM